MSERTVIPAVPPATPLAALQGRIEAASVPAIAGTTVAGVALSLAGLFATGPLGALLLVPLALVVVALGIAALRYRRRVASLPLEISPVALVGHQGSARTYRFRARLGRGRRVVDPLAEVLVVGPDGRRIPLATARLPRLVGPFTVLAVDAVGAPGDLLVRVSGREGGRRWETERTFPRGDLRPGRFGAGVVRRRGRLELDPAAWDAVLPEEGP